MIFYHRTTEQAWQQIQKDKRLWGYAHNPDHYKYTYLAPFDWGDSYGPVLLEVQYEPLREDRGNKHNYGFDPPEGEICVQFSVFEPIDIKNVRRII